MKTNVISPRGWRTTQAGCRALRALYACSSDPPGDVGDGREYERGHLNAHPVQLGGHWGRALTIEEVLQRCWRLRLVLLLSLHLSGSKD